MRFASYAPLWPPLDLFLLEIRQVAHVARHGPVIPLLYRRIRPLSAADPIEPVLHVLIALAFHSNLVRRVFAAGRYEAITIAEDVEASSRADEDNVLAFAWDNIRQAPLKCHAHTLRILGDEIHVIGRIAPIIVLIDPPASHGRSGFRDAEVPLRDIH